MMLPSSRVRAKSSDRVSDRIVYFDYSKSLATQKRPIPWKVIAVDAVVFGFVGFYETATGGRFGFVEPSALRGLVFTVPCMLLALGLIPVIRASRALSGDNFVETKRRR